MDMPNDHGCSRPLDSRSATAGDGARGPDEGADARSVGQLPYAVLALCSDAT